MSQCVPSWDLDNNPSSTARHTLHALSNADSTAADDPTSDYEVAELIWANGQLALQGLGHPRIVTRPIPSFSSKYSSWSEKPRAGGTLESIVNQAAQFLPSKSLSPVPHCDNATAAATNPWFNPHHTTTTTPHPITMDALVPCSHPPPIPSTAAADDDPSSHVPNPDNNGIGTCVGSCSVAGTPPEAEKQISLARKRARVARVNATTAYEGNSHNQSASASASVSMHDARLDMCDVELDATSLGSQDNTSSGKPWPSSTKPTTVDDHDSVCHSRSHQKRESGEGGEDRKKSQSGRSSVKTKRSRAAAIHNQSERKRRDKINQRMKTLQKLIPNSSKTDKASMLDEVIEYLKQLQAQVQMMSRMIPQMMLPMTMQQQLQMSMMAQMAGMGMGMGIGMGVMDINLIGRSNMQGIPPVLPPSAFMPLASWDVSGDHRLSTSNATMPDPLSSFFACHSQPMTMDTYSRMAALFQQFHQPPTSNAKT